MSSGVLLPRPAGQVSCVEHTMPDRTEPGVVGTRRALPFASVGTPVNTKNAEDRKGRAVRL